MAYCICPKSYRRCVVTKITHLTQQLNQYQTTTQLAQGPEP